MTTITKWLNNPYVLSFLLWATVIAYLVSWGFAADLNKSEWASWVQGVGTIAAVAAAFFVADWQVKQQRKNAAALVRQMFYPTAFALDELAFVYGPPSRPHRGDTDDEPDVFSIEKWQEIADHANIVVAQHKKFEARIHRYEAGLNLLSANSLGAALGLETELEDALQDSVTHLVRPPETPYDPRVGTVELLAQCPTWSSRFALHTFNRHVQKYMAELERESS